MMKKKRMLWVVLAVYLITWIPSVFIIRGQRDVYNPKVYPVIPFIVLSCDNSPLAGEWTLYFSYVFGVKRLFEIKTWIA
jgi:hypothetical protein